MAVVLVFQLPYTADYFLICPVRQFKTSANWPQPCST